MVEAIVLTGPFDGDDVVGLFDHADHTLITACTFAVKAGISISDVITDAAFADFQLGVANGVGKRDGVFRAGAQDMESKALCRLLADAGQSFELIDKPGDRFGKVRHQRSPASPPSAFRALACSNEGACATAQEPEPGRRPKLKRSMFSRERVRTIRGFSNLRFQESRRRVPSFGKPIPHQRAGLPR